MLVECEVRHQGIEDQERGFQLMAALILSRFNEL